MHEHARQNECTRRAAIVATVLAASAASSVRAQCTYEMTIIQAPECPIIGPPASLGNAVTERGGIAGEYAQCDVSQDEAFVWTADGGFVTLERLPGWRGAEARDVNEAGLVVGRMKLPDIERNHAVLWQDGQVVDLGTLEGGNRSEANAVNGHGQIVGTWANNVVAFAFLWQDGKMIDLGPSIGGVRSEADDINNRGQIVGWRRLVEGGEPIAYLLDEDGVVDLGPIPGGFRSEAKAINSHGQVVGNGRRIDPEGTTVRAFLWSAGAMTDLGILPGFQYSGATDINDAGQIVGQCWGPGANTTGFIWEDGVMRDLDDLTGDGGATINFAKSINESGQITGRASTTDAFLLTPRAVRIGDIDCDGAVGMSDLLYVLARWGPCALCPADLDSDGTVGTTDLTILLTNWG